jgi:hypothetical protein
MKKLLDRLTKKVKIRLADGTEESVDCIDAPESCRSVIEFG